MMIETLVLAILVACCSADLRRVPSAFKDGTKWELTQDSRKGYARTSHYDHHVGTDDHLHVDVSVHPVGQLHTPGGLRHIHKPLTVGQVHTPVGGAATTGLLTQSHLDHPIGRTGYVHPHLPGTVGEIKIVGTQLDNRAGLVRHYTGHNPGYVVTETHIPIQKTPETPTKAYLPAKTVKPAKTYLPSHY